LAAAKGRRAHAPAFTLQAGRREADRATEPDAPRFGLTATRKIGGAVERNRMKRRVREALRQEFGPCGQGRVARPGYDYVLVLRREALSASFAEVRRQLGQAFARVHAPKAAAGPATPSRERLAEEAAERAERRKHDARAADARARNDAARPTDDARREGRDARPKTPDETRTTQDDTRA
jgi:ribonuclease P protein component